MTLSWIPNALTIARCLLALVCAAAVFAGERLSRKLDAAVIDWQMAGSPVPGSPGYPAALENLVPGDLLFWPAFAFAAFLAAAVTDLFDGMMARSLDAVSEFGAWLDPIADKLLVGLVLVAISVTSGSLWLMFPAAVIITRDSYITWLRARLGGGLALPVMAAAKWKTGLEMLAIGLLLALPLIASVSHGVMVNGVISPVEMAWIGVFAERFAVTLAWISAGLSVWTGMRYWRASREHPETLRETFD